MIEHSLWIFLKNCLKISFYSSSGTVWENHQTEKIRPPNFDISCFFFWKPFSKKRGLTKFELNSLKSFLTDWQMFKGKECSQNGLKKKINFSLKMVPFSQIHPNLSFQKVFLLDFRWTLRIKLQNYKKNCLLK